MAEFNGRTLTLLTVGGLVTLAALKGYSPARALRGFITGAGPASVQTSPIGSPGSVVPDTSNSPVSGDPATNRAVGRIMAARYGWVGAEWSALDSLWSRESGWKNTADNPNSHAYGIPQALPASKLPVTGQPLSLGGQSSATSQIAWGLSYIRTRYGAPSVAWQHETEFGWY